MSLFRGNRALLDAFRAGEAFALEEVYTHYVQKIELLVAHGWYDPKNQSRAYGVADYEVQVELVQEIFMRAFAEKARLAYDGVRPYKVFLLRIARNVIVDYIRKKPRDALSHAFIELDSDEINNSNVSVFEQLGEISENETELDWQRCVVATEAFVKQLENVEKRFIDLRFKQELSLLEVARRLEMTRGKARFLEKDLGKKLKRHLQTMNLSVNFK
jgi:RNA polymerase sigma factor (sigma-70 family)